MRAIWIPVVVAAASVPAALLAQAAAPKPFAPGDIFIDRNGDTLQITKCKGSGWQAECQLRRLAESGNAPIDPTERWWSVDTLRGSEKSWISEGNAPYSGPAVPLPGAAAAVGPNARVPQGGRQPARNQQVANVPATASAGGACPKTPYGGPVSGSRSPSAALFKQKVSDSYTMAAYPPYWYGVEFESFSVGAPIRNVVSNVPGSGATRVTNGAPPNATLYPVTSVQRVCEGAPSGGEPWRRDSKRYYCFVTKEHEWTCGAR
jgi:hypothetical protein